MNLNEKLNKIVEILTERKDIELTLLQKLHLSNVKSLRTEETFFYYTNCWRVLNLFFKQNETRNTTQINFSLMYDFISFTKFHGHCETSINKYIKCLKTALNFAVKNSYLEINVLRNFDLLKEQEKKPKVLENEIIEKVFNYLYTGTKNKIEIRNKIILQLFLETGMRLKELNNILIENIDFTNNLIKLETTKTKKDRYVPISIETKKIIVDFMFMIKKHKGYLFLNLKTYEKLNKKSIAKIIDKIRKKLNITKSISPHKWRHTFATLSLKNGADPFYLKSVLGHASIKTTNIYIHLNNEDIKNVHQKTNPLNHIMKSL